MAEPVHYSVFDLLRAEILEHLWSTLSQVLLHEVDKHVVTDSTVEQ